MHSIHAFTRPIFMLTFALALAVVDLPGAPGAPGATGNVASAQVFEDGYGAVDVTNADPKPRQVRTPPANTRVGRKRYAENQEAQPETGRDAAVKYMSPRQPANSSGGSVDHYLQIAFGWSVNDQSFKWGQPDNQSNVGRWNFGISYRMGEWVNSMDLLMRVEATRLAMAEGGVTKFSFMPLITFPDASSRFPLYFGAGIGLGIFGNQFGGESSLALDYQVLAGARFFNLWGSAGLFVEGGVKNHIHVLSDGQYNGTFVSTGTLFTF
ncbi:MAG TPA: hypothetical protein PLZ57_02755 [Pseudobdellovibrionaceae bacterium]|nr:hypothetical protein [Pseudobdellovibrionaceae bacterium]